jgi:serine/threonine protein kinase
MFPGQTDVMTVTQLTPAADIYSLAKSIYWLVTGESPRFFANRTITELPLAVRNEPWAGELLGVLERATQSDPSKRQQSVDDLWTDLAGLRRIASDGETVTSVRHRMDISPQPHVSRGYTPIVPRQARFDTARDLQLRFPAIPDPVASPVEDHVAPLPSWADDGLQAPTADPDGREQFPPGDAPKSKRRKGVLARTVIFTIFIAAFAGLLYGTHLYLRGSGVLPELRNPFKTQTAVANTDIYLRPSPNTSNDPIGLVTKNSKVRIVKSQNNWYEVDVVEQGRQRNDQPSETHGWLNGKYLDIDQ